MGVTSPGVFAISDTTFSKAVANHWSRIPVRCFKGSASSKCLGPLQSGFRS